MRNVSGRFVEKIRTHILRQKIVSPFNPHRHPHPSESRAVYEIMCKKYGTASQVTDDRIIRHGKDAICLPDNYVKNTDTHSEYLIFIACSRRQRLRERAAVLW